MTTYLTEDEVRELYRTRDSAHDFDHVLRVVRMAAHIAHAEGANVEIVRLAALLHDVPTQDSVFRDTDGSARKAHHLAAADAARTLLRARGMDPVVCDQVSAAIESHRFRERTRAPETLEAKCLYDADKLDSMGAIGVARAFAYAGMHGNRLFAEPGQAIARGLARGASLPQGHDYTPVHEYVYKLGRLLDTLHTATARAIGRERHAFMVAFFSQLEGEMTDEQ